MGKDNREKEVKLAIEAPFWSVSDQVRNIVKSIHPDFSFVEGVSTDSYWFTPKDSKADFIRLRKNPNTVAHLTAKGSDKGNNIDRVEIDLDVEFNQANTLMTFTFGKPVIVKKKYHVFFLEDEHTNISVYQVYGKSVIINKKEVKPIFVEIEATSINKLKELTKAFMDSTDKGNVYWIKSSIYDMYVAESKVKHSNVENFFNES